MALNAAAHGFYIANGWEWHVVAGDRNAVCRSYAKQFLAGCSRTFFVHVKADMQIVLLHRHDLVIAGVRNEHRALAFALNVERRLAGRVTLCIHCINAGDDAITRFQRGHFIGDRNNVRLRLLWDASRTAG